MTSKIGFVRQATKQIVYKQPRFYLNAKEAGTKFTDSINDDEDILTWTNDREPMGEEYAIRHVKSSRVKFLRKKAVQKYKWDHFLNYICENYETVRENAREISRGPNRLAKIERANAWLGDYHD
ncbi:hypothetical protein RB653_007493 [Dictyostelium firmibasis]|uniref:Uncharacterized protein n=1 Tax=Dictyostelium firmibasis TaxID=79012 RepID=A0AAN7YUP9_9MYCE